MSTYTRLRMDGSNETRFGKTSLAWQAALRGEKGLTRLAIPDRHVNDPSNPWNPMVSLTPEMAGAYVMPVRDHLQAIGVTCCDRPNKILAKKVDVTPEV